MSALPPSPGSDLNALSMRVQQLEQELQRTRSSNQALSLMADRLQDAVLIGDAQRCITWVNPAFTRLSGFSLNECQGLQPEELLSGPLTDSNSVTRINQALADGQSIDRIEMCHHRKDGEPFWVSRSVQRLVNRQGEVTHHIEVFSDISERRRADNEYSRRLQAEVALANKAEFLARMGHNMRSSLNAILGFSQLLEMEASHTLPEAQQAQVGHIHAAGQQLLQLLDQAMAYAQLDTRPIKLRHERLDLTQLVRQVQHELESEAAAKHVQILTDLQPLTLWADAQQTQTVLRNLLRNAIQFSPEQATVLIQAKPATDQAMALIEVKDSGFGIEAQRLEHIFQPLQHAQDSRQTHTGTGLGLAISQRLAELMNGRIEVSSSLGRGSTFTLQLPLAQAPQAAGSKPAAFTPSGPKVMLPPLRIVHIEDNRLNRSLVEALFAAYPQVRLYSSETAKEGLNSIEQIHPDLALVDINLPDGSGLDLCRRIRAHTNASLRQLPLIALSADAMPDDISKALQTGFDHYLVKPLQIQRLLSILATLPSTQAAPPQTQ